MHAYELFMCATNTFIAKVLNFVSYNLDSRGEKNIYTLATIAENNNLHLFLAMIFLLLCMIKVVHLFCVLNGKL